MPKIYSSIENSLKQAYTKNYIDKEKHNKLPITNPNSDTITPFDVLIFRSVYSIKSKQNPFVWVM